MIKVTVAQIVESAEAFKWLQQKEMSARLSYKIGKLIIQIDNECKMFEEARLKIIEKYGEKDTNGQLIEHDGQVKIPPDAINTANNELQELLTVDVELTLDPLKVDELDSLNIPPATMVKLIPFIEE